MTRTLLAAVVFASLCRAADLPNFATLDVHLADTQHRVRASFNRILGAAS